MQPVILRVGVPRKDRTRQRVTEGDGERLYNAGGEGQAYLHCHTQGTRFIASPELYSSTVGTYAATTKRAMLHDLLDTQKGRCRPGWSSTCIQDARGLLFMWGQNRVESARRISRLLALFSRSAPGVHAGQLRMRHNIRELLQDDDKLTAELLDWRATTQRCGDRTLFSRRPRLDWPAYA